MSTIMRIEKKNLNRGKNGNRLCIVSRESSVPLRVLCVLRG